MKGIGKFFALATLGIAMVACNNAPTESVEASEAEEVVQPEETTTTETYAVSDESTKIEWIGFKTYSDDQHNGVISVKEGDITVENGEIVAGSFVIDMNSIQDLSMDGNEEYQQKLVGHLKSADFFDVENHPVGTFNITAVEAVEGSEDGATHNISGNLKLRGEEKNITFPAMVSMEEGTVNIKTPEFVIDRTNWNVTYGSANLGSIAKDKLIDNNIKLVVDLKAQKA